MMLFVDINADTTSQNMTLILDIVHIQFYHMCHKACSVYIVLCHVFYLMAPMNTNYTTESAGCYKNQ